MKELELTEEQKQSAIRFHKENPDLLFVTRKVFENEKIDGRSKEGRAIREFLSQSGINYNTTSYKEKVPDVVLTDKQKEYILQNCQNMTGFQLARVIFPEKNIRSPLTKECSTIIQFIRENSPSELSEDESGVGVTYIPPSNTTEAIAKINASTIQQLIPTKLSAQHRQAVAAFLRFINAPRVIQIISNYSSKEDRELFESEFIRFTWDKPDLTMDDITLYISVCQDIVTNKKLHKQQDGLNKMLELAMNTGNRDEGDMELSVRLSETIKTKVEEYDKVQKRIESVLKKLNGDRANRLKNMGERSSNFLALVEAYQLEDERKRLLTIAKAAREKVKEEVNRIESLEDFRARIMGISKEEVL
jgi:hypothetical protein